MPELSSRHEYRQSLPKPATAAVAMLHYWYRSNGFFIPRSKELLSRLVSLDEHLGMDAQHFFMAPPEDRWSLAKRIADRTIGVYGFFEWESEPEIMSKLVEK